MRVSQFTFCQRQQTRYVSHKALQTTRLLNHITGIILMDNYAVRTTPEIMQSSVHDCVFWRLSHLLMKHDKNTSSETRQIYLERDKTHTPSS